jgi:hypothetical protein
MRRFYVTSYLLTLCLATFLSPTIAQQQINGFSIKKIDTRDFPTVKGELWVRDPDGVIPRDVDFLEENSTKPIKPQLDRPKEAKDSLGKNKCIIFLVMNPGNSMELNWYKEVVKKGVCSGSIQKGDKYVVLDYNNEAGGQLLFPATPSFTDDAVTFSRQVDMIQPRTVPTVCQVGSTLGYQAIIKALDILESQYPRIPSGIVILNRDYNCFGNDPTGLCRQLDVPVYSVIYNGGTELNSSRDLSKKTFGIYFSDPTRNAVTSSSKICDFLNNFLKRRAGFNYPFTYKSGYEKDGKPHTISLSYKGMQSVSRIDVPRKNLLEWIVANPIPAALVLLGIILLTVLAFVFINKRKKEAEQQRLIELQREQQMERQRIEKEEELASKIASQQNEMDSLKKREAAARDQEARRKAQEEQKKKDEALMAQMKLNGNYAWLDYSSGDGVKHRFEIRRPEFVVGRDPSCQLCINLPTVSKKHLQVNYTASNEYWVKDLGSSNGIYVNGQRVQQARLKHGDFIQAGELVLNFFL